MRNQEPIRRSPAWIAVVSPLVVVIGCSTTMPTSPGAGAGRIESAMIRESGARAAEPFSPEDDETKQDSAKDAPTDTPKEGPCLPLHTVEGMSGHFSVPSAYICNPAKPGDVLGYPSVGWIYVNMEKGRSLNAFTATEALWDRVELGLGYDVFEVGDFYQCIQDNMGATISGHSVKLLNATARVVAIKDGDFGLSWMPQITAGATYKYNFSLDNIEDDLGAAACKMSGIENDQGVDFTLFASKAFPIGSVPIIATLGARATKAAAIGLLGFTDDYKLVMEGAVCCMPTPWLVLAAEYRGKPSEYHDAPPCLAAEDDWWVLAAGFLVSNDCSIAVGYGHFGEVLNHSANASYGVAIKYEF